MDPTIAFRWLPLAGMLGTLATSAYFRHRARREGGIIPRSQEALPLRLARLVIALPLLGSLVLAFVRPSSIAWAAVPLPVWARAVGTVMTLAAVPAAWWTFTSIGQNVSETVLTKADHVLVTSGPYRWIRHPLYATGTILLVGVGLATANGCVLVLAIFAGWAVATRVVPLEEQALESRFGDEYVRYAGRTGRLWPRIRRER
jgi:protein-S-isoprenylcysteine O-methyltransferase